MRYLSRVQASFSFDLHFNTEKLSDRGGVCGMFIFSGIEGSSGSLLLHFVARLSRRRSMVWCDLAQFKAATQLLMYYIRFRSKYSRLPNT